MKPNAGNVTEAQFSLIVCGQELATEEISKQLKLEPTRSFKKGELLNRLPEIVAQEDAWCHTIQLSQPEEHDPALLGMLSTISESKAYLSDMRAKGYSVTLRLSVNSNKAFMGYSLTSETLAALTGIGFPLEVNTVSWGEMTF